MNKNRLSQCFAVLFGRLAWTSPPWFSYLRRHAASSPKAFGAATASIIVLLVGMAYGYVWFKNLPQPALVTAVVTAPKITPVQDEGLVPDGVVVDFGYVTPGSENNFTPQSVAPLKQLDKEVTKGITVSPRLEGKWVWQSDSRLEFTPAHDWPAGQTYRIHFAKEVFSAEAKIKSDTATFSTQPFEAKIADFIFYQDPVNAKLRQAVATINFNFPVDTASFENNTSLMFEALKQGKLDLNAQHYKFDISYDKYKRVAYLHSEALSLPQISRYLLLTLKKGITSASHTDETHQAVTQNLFIPDVGHYFKILSTTASIVRNDADRPEQLLILESSLGVTEAEIKKSLQVYLLPENYPATATEAEKKNYDWQNPGEVTPSILALSKPLALKTMPSENNYATLHSYQFSAQTPRYMYLKLKKDMRGFGGFALTSDYEAVIKVPELPKEISFLHKGALLAFSGEKKLSVLVRGLPAVKFEFARVLPDNVNQLVTQTKGDFNNPTFINQSFNRQNISEIFDEIQQFDASDLTKQQYTAVDFSKYLAAATNTEGPQGLFLLQARGWDVEHNGPLDVQANRLILITDLGLVVKDNKDGSHDVFVQSITEGAPRANVNVSVLGKNGLPVLTQLTDEQGRASFPVLTGYVDEREPVAYLANLENDVSFIPYNNATRQLNYSRYDVGGTFSSNQDRQHLSAYLFSDRGIYRPGDLAHVGIIVKQAYAAAQLAGFPIQLTITDPRGVMVEDKQLTLDEWGYLTVDFQTNATSPTGQYQINLYIVKDGHQDSLLGSTTINVAEFQPDRMRIKTHLSAESVNGWISPTGLTANVELWNLYGAPATDRRISGRILLQPKSVAFKQYPDYVFADPALDPKKPAKVFNELLAEVKTDDKGQADFKLNLERFEKATYQLTFFAEGFEAEGGRSVAAQSTALVSPLPYFVGYKPDGDLNFIKQNSQRSVQFIAVNPHVTPVAVNDLTLQLVALHPVSTLVKKADGTYQYQSVMQTTVVSTQPFSLNEKGTNFVLPSEKIGDFAITILDKQNTELSHLKYSIVGTSQQSMTKNAELTVKLDRETYHAGDEIELQITAPYTGAGLITIERDKVYTSQWFKTDMSSSVQKIRIPNGVQGNAYVNVAFVRDWNSPDIFTSPLSYSVAPFEINHDAQDVHIDLKTPELARPGEPLTIEYQTDKPGKIIVFAVDEGVLQVANYTTPDPLAFFFEKRALEVLTQQTVDQILPEYIKERELSAVGGDASQAFLAMRLNPFRRSTDFPIAYWSGIVDTDSIPRQLVYNVPDYFNGTLHIMAVAVALDAVGAADKQAEVRGHFVINPNVPTFVAPGDEFEITASVANNVKDSGADAKVTVQLQVTPELELIGSATESLTIAEGKEQTVHFKLRAKSILGSAKATLTASIGDHSSTMDATMSVRPANPFFTSVTSGMSQETKKSLAVERVLFPEYRQVEAAMSSSPLILVSGLQRYLDNFPYGCTEQLTSKAFPLLAMAKQPWFAPDEQVLTSKVMTTIQMLSQRQMSDGGFSYWPGVGENAGNLWASVYAMHFLTDARAQGYAVSAEMLNGGLNYLRTLASQNVATLEAARTQAYAIYVLTRNELVTTNYLTNLQLYLDKNQPSVWQSDLTGAYIAATYALLKDKATADQLIDQYKSPMTSSVWPDFYDKNIADAQYLYLVARHFPEKLSNVGDKIVLQLVSAMNSGEINTLLSSYASLAFSAYGQADQDLTDGNFSISELLMDNQSKVLAALDNHYAKVSVDEHAKQISYLNPDKQRYFYQLTQSGFDEKLPTEAIKKGVEIYREYRDSKGNVVTSVPLGTEIQVHIQARALDNHYINHMVVVDLLPGGFEVVRDSVKEVTMDYADTRDDRVIFFGSLDASAKEIVYRIKAINTGTYTVPPIVAESMYDPNVSARGVAGKISVTDIS